MTFSKTIDREKAYDLYINKNMKAKDVAGLLGCTENGLRILIHRERWIKSPKEQIHVDKNTLYDLYINQNLSREEVAGKLNLSTHTVKRRLKEYGIKKSTESHIANIKKSCMKKYGLSNGGWTLETQEKIKKTNLERYGTESYLKSNEYKVKIKEILNKLGVTNVFQLKEVKELIKNTNLEKYSVEYISQNKEILEKIVNGIKKNWENKTPEELESIRRKHSECTKKVLWKINETKRKNKTFNTSEPEQEIKRLLEHKYSDLKCQYSSKLYPFLCDFYIPQLDTYIEYQGTWTHGKEPFIETEEQMKKLKDWKERAKYSEFYSNAIHVWTISDPLKRKIAKKNNLNWFEFFTMDEFLEWFESM